MEILFRNLEHVLFCEILRQKFRLWSAVIGQSAVFTNIDMKRRRCCLHLAFESLFSVRKVLSFERKISKFFFRNRISKLIFNVKGVLQ